MNEKITIKGNKIKILEGYQDNDQINILMILLIIKYSVNGKTLSVPLKKIAFILDAVKKNVSVKKLSTLLSSPWEISGSLRKNIILSHEKKYLVIKDNNGVISFGLSITGLSIVTEVEENNIMPEIRKEIMKWCKAVSMTELKKQQLIW
ncbi:hypothetical protein HYN56_11330 [Flavobacterium crocinum]|uniref:Uncharacterized protein n=1 Tax=Flavobacterium crocinum TaxID=2183896 RepID=A0A2S1YL40_9FLAO|nr:hypothetical protein [Flavobacterium crocinum]AWK04784.1 hypothetical protein HYN56_11330 [Flavobacterium crocinum]